MNQIIYCRHVINVTVYDRQRSLKKFNKCLNGGYFVKKNINLKNEFGEELRKRLKIREEGCDRRKRLQKEYSKSDVDKIRKEYESLPEEQKKRMTEFLDWVLDKKLFQKSSTKNPSFSIGRKAKNRIMTVYVTEKITLIFHPKHYLKGINQRNTFVNKRKSLGLLPENLNLGDNIEKRALTKKLWEMDEDGLANFRECIIEAVK